MRWLYSNRQQSLLALMLMTAIGVCTWLNSDWRLEQRIAGKLWSYQRETLSESELASLILSTPIESWWERGNLRLLSNGEAQLDLAVQLKEHRGLTADLRISIQGRWLLSDGFLILKSSSYTALPFNDAGKKLLARHAQPLKDIWLALFNRSRPLTLLDEQHILLTNQDNSIWVLSAREDPDRVSSKKIGKVHVPFRVSPNTVARLSPLLFLSSGVLHAHTLSLRPVTGQQPATFGGNPA